MGVSLLYQTSYLAVFFALLFWMLLAEYRQVGKYFRFVFFFALTAWAISVAQSDGSNSFKLLVVFRDLLTVAVGSLIVYFARSNKMVGILAVLGMFFIMMSWYVPVLKGTFAPGTSIISLDPDAELLVDAKEGVDHAQIQEFLATRSVSVKRAFHPASSEITELDDYYLIDLRSGDHIADHHTVLESTRLLNESGLVDWIEENEVVSTTPIEGEEELRTGGKFGLNDPFVDKLWAFDVLDIEALYNVLTSLKPHTKTLIAILDTGVDGQHEDLADNFVTINKLYDNDVRGHGTHVAGIAAAVSNNHKGIASFLPNEDFVAVTSIKVLSDMGAGSQATIIKGMIEAADYGVDVISMSLGGRTNEKKQKAYEDALSYCNKKGVIVVAAAGNSNRNAQEISPANIPGVITVSAINANMEKAYFSNTVDGLRFPIAAPGEDIYSTFPKNQYKSFKGTSMAAPYVASIIGLLRSINPALTTEKVHALLSDTGLDSRSTHLTGRVIQPAQAVTRLISEQQDPNAL
ncbi:MAG: S8 family serine peptidase [Saprospiraceae bacterium]|nr:S8 family serine peptidase [Saprospiraceae bacterium]